MTSPMFPAIGKGRRSPVPKGTPVQAGHWRKHAKGKPVRKREILAIRMVKPVPVDPLAPKRLGAP
jgi:hypothetical protein